MPKSPETLVPVAHAPGHTAAHAMASALRDAGIEAFVFDTAKTALQWEAPSVIAPYQVHVRREDEELARQTLADNRDASVDIDWDGVDLGQPEDQTAARIAKSQDAPWMRSSRPSHRPKRDAVFNATKVGVVGWILGATALGVIAAVVTFLRII